MAECECLHVSVLLYEFRLCLGWQCDIQAQEQCEFACLFVFVRVFVFVLCACVLVFAHTAVNTAPVLTSWHLHNVSRWLCQPPVTTVSARPATRAWGDDCDYLSWLHQFGFRQYWWCLWATVPFSSSYTTEYAFVTLATISSWTYDMFCAST